LSFKIGSAGLRCPHDHEGAETAAGLQGLDVADLWQGAGQGLAPAIDAKTCFAKAMLDVLGRVEGSLTVEDTLCLVREIILANRALAIDEADDEPSLWV